MDKRIFRYPALAGLKTRGDQFNGNVERLRSGEPRRSNSSFRQIRLLRHSRRRAILGSAFTALDQLQDGGAPRLAADASGVKVMASLAIPNVDNILPSAC